MQLYQLKPKHTPKTRKRVGRGGKKGTYCGKGMKGQKSRAGSGFTFDFAGGDTTFAQRPAKKRGTVGHTKRRHGVKLERLRDCPVVVNLSDIEKKYRDKEVVSPETLFQKKLVKSEGKNKLPSVKILGDGKLTKKVTFEKVTMSKAVKEKLNK